MRPAASPQTDPLPEGARSRLAARNSLAGFFLSGLLMAFLGAILPAWGHHLESDHSRIGFYFLSLNAGLWVSVPVSQQLLRRRSLRFLLILGTSISAAAFFYLAAVGPPREDAWRLAGAGFCGLGAGLINAGVFVTISPAYRRDPASTVNLCGLLFGLGSLTSSLLVAGTYYIYTTGAILTFLGVIPGYMIAYYATSRWVPEEIPADPPTGKRMEELRSPAAILLALLLFFQFGNEWAIAGWLPLFLVQQLGVSPATALLLLSLYWLALTMGRLIMQAVLPQVRHGRLLLGSVLAACFGCFSLSLTDSLAGASMSLLLIGGGFAAIYPLVVEKIGHRFPYYHPGVFNGMFSLAVTGGLLAAASLGVLADWVGLWVIMGLPVAGSLAVLVLLLLLWLEARLNPQGS
ncbi:MAG: MFS transporter [Bryobacterales bacterium]|nr:MFS transporter [Bryobacterales bacterium]